MARQVLVTGAGRGIGLSLVEHLLQKGCAVWATYRTADKASMLLRLAEEYDKLTLAQLDITDEEQLGQLAVQWQQVSFDWIINNAGIYGPSHVSFQNVNTQEWLDIFRTNTIAPFMVAKMFYPNLLKGTERKLAFLSSKVGSIEDNTSGGGYLYRTSKTALNQVVKSLSIDLMTEDVCVLALHPGWVKTAMGGPNALISADVSATGLISVIEYSDLSASGQFWNFDGKLIPW